MAYRNGQLPSSVLTTVASGVQLVNATANAYKSLKLIAALDRMKVEPAAGIGSGYRSLAVQRVFWAADHGDKAAQNLTKHTPGATPVASPGYSSHGKGTRIDLLFDGTSLPNNDQLELAAKHGWHREFGRDDPNHFAHDGLTSISGPSDHDRNRILAAWLNNLHLGRTTKTEQDGTHSTDPNVEQIYTWLIQTKAHADGLYRTPTYKIDGKWGPRTAWCERHYWNQIWNQ